jgi:hypothetical protein
MVIEVNYNSNLDSLMGDIFLNKKITNQSPSNMYEFLFESEDLNTLCDYVVERLKTETGENFDVLVKTIYGYIQDEENQEPIMIDKKLKEGLTTTAKYSFILNAHPEDMLISIKVGVDSIKTTTLKVGKLLIFKTEDFIKCKSNGINKFLIVGSLSNDITKSVNKKSII